MSNESHVKTQREFILYWLGFIVMVSSAVSVLLVVSGLLVDVLSYRCWYPIISPMLGVANPPQGSQIANFPFYCANPAVAIVTFAFKFLSAMIVGGAGGYMMLNGKPH